MDLHCTNLLIVVAVGFLAPLTLGFVPRLQLLAVVLEIVAGIVVGPSVLGWVEVDDPVAVLSIVGLAFLPFLEGLVWGFPGGVRVSLGALPKPRLWSGAP